MPFLYHPMITKNIKYNVLFYYIKDHNFINIFYISLTF